MQGWEQDTIIHDGDEFFDTLLSTIRSATRRVDLESYIFASDILGFRIAGALTEAASRGVRVRVIVDGIGSLGWLRSYELQMRQAGVRYRVYHKVPWERSLFKRERLWTAFTNLLKVIRSLNNRTHRKICIVDDKIAFVGSRNISAVHLPSVYGDLSWRDTSAILQGEGVKLLIQGFERVWYGGNPRVLLKERRKLKRLASSSPAASLVRLNISRKLRTRNFKDILSRIRNARERVWITNAYFVPPRSLLSALAFAASRGVDVRILLPQRSDVRFVPLVASALQRGLLMAGAKVFEYEPCVLHAKTILIDDWALVGSSNLNHRSILHDLEADVVITSKPSQEELQAQFLVDLSTSKQITLSDWEKRSRLTRTVGEALLLFRNWM